MVKLNTLKENDKNPRFITPESLAELCGSIKEDEFMMRLNPIVVDENNLILAGNQRFKALQELGFEEVDDSWVKKDTDLSEAEKRRFIIKDNLHSGEWDNAILREEWDRDELDEMGVETFSEKIESIDEGEEIHFEQSLQIDPPREYIMIMAEPNSQEWEELKMLMKLKRVRRGGYTKGGAFDATGIERVLEWSDFKKRFRTGDKKKKS